MATKNNGVLVSWVAVNNDPFVRDRAGDYRLEGGETIPGPTLTLLFDPDSPYRNRIRDVVLFYRQTAEKGYDRDRRALEETKAELRRRDPALEVHCESWSGDDPTDHKAIYEWLRQRLPIIRRRFAGRDLIIHSSPGTPAMHTLWVLMAETGLIDPPFRVVKSYRGNERQGRAAVVPVEIGLETFYKAWRHARPLTMASTGEAVLWDPVRFRSSALRQLYDEARRFARLNVPVLILGERGTGKTTLANWIRLNSPFRRRQQDGHWPAVACGQYSPETMRAELFGYRKGAFTGANENREGLLAAAHEDTLFLDEIGDVSRDLQRLLIKALEEHRYLPLGEDKPRRSEFRLLTATNLPLDELQKRLDPDFLDRIALLTLRLPPLREIPEDLPWLWRTVMEQAQSRARVQVDLADDEHEAIVQALCRHPLPGNLRDLFVVAYRLLAVRADSADSLSAGETLDYALAGLRAEPDLLPEERARKVIRAFAENRPLTGLVAPNQTLDTRAIDRTFKAYLADELRRLAKEYRVSPRSLCDVTDRCLNNWIVNGAGK